MDILIKINNQTVGRDKIARLLQYLSRFFWHRLQQNHKKGVENFKDLEFQLSTFRKLLRFGRCVDALHSCLPLVHQEDILVRITSVISKMCYSIFLVADHILWLGRSNLCNINTTKWSQFANKAWLYSITMNIIKDIHDIYGILRAQEKILPEGSSDSANNIKLFLLKLKLILHNNKDVVIDTIKNTCDIFIPSTSLGYTKFSPGTVGILGAVSSIAGLLVLIESAKKVAPS